MKRARSRRTKKVNNTMLLTQELIVQILLRLPVKSLVRFQCVSKTWFSLISDPQFAKSHFDLAFKPPTHKLVLLADSEILSIDFNASLHDDSASSALTPPNYFQFSQPYSSAQILGSCRGFLLLDCGDLCLWNPTTGSYKQICMSPIGSNLLDAMFFTFLYGFGYDPSKDDYLVVMVSYDPNTHDSTRAEMFSLRANGWKEMEGTHLSYMNCSDDARVGKLLNGAIHWLAYRYDVLVDLIVAFDLTERSFSDIPLPIDFEIDMNFCELEVLGGFLSLYVVGCDSPAEIWVMEEYKVQSSWTKTIVVSVDHIPNRYFSLVCSTESGDVVGTDGRTGLVKSDDKGQLKEHRSYSDDYLRVQVAVYTESLLSLPVEEDN
ncbi:hypothetical protein RJT34_19135 [Clitoria ternatea]|uniref:F-box domain-containing protein n=1 Tax=Clitoria ternatea TaxID=43366 RepID=A0AAN9P377_CLITE